MRVMEIERNLPAVILKLIALIVFVMKFLELAARLAAIERAARFFTRQRYTPVHLMTLHRDTHIYRYF